jgi:hypothetical protein
LERADEDSDEREDGVDLEVVVDRVLLLSTLRVVCVGSESQRRAARVWRRKTYSSRPTC